MVVLFAAGTARAQAPTDAADSATDQAPAPQAAPDRLARWADLQTINVLGRFRYVETSAHVVTSRQLQDGAALKARLKLDREARFSVTSVAATGPSGTSAWNNTGIGTGEPVHALAVKQLYLAVVPLTGVEVAYGGLAPIRGESTEITSYDNDVYLVGERISMRRPKGWFFDEISGTAAFLGDLETPNVFRRLDRLADVNYGQLLVSKKLTPWLTGSADLTHVSRVSTFRSAVSVALQGHPVDAIRYEQYARAGDDGAFGFAVTAERSLLRRVTLGLGYADIDARYGGLNGDRYNRGHRLFETGVLRLSPEISIAFFATQAIRNDVPIANHRRFDLVLTYNALASLKRAGVIR